MIRFVIWSCRFVSRSSTFSILPTKCFSLPSLSVIAPSSFMRRSRSFSCSFRTFIMKSRASRASSLSMGFLDICGFSIFIGFIGFL